MAKIADIAIKYMPHLPGCPRPTIVGAVLDTICDVCERTYVWREELDPHPISDGDRTYRFLAKTENIQGEDAERGVMKAEVPEGVEVISILVASIDEGNLRFLPMREVNRRYSQWLDDEDDHKGRPVYITSIEAGTFSISPRADGEYTLDMIVAAKPTSDATEIPDGIASEMRDCIYHGSLQRLLVIPDKPWSDSEESMRHGNKYSFYLNMLRVRVNKGVGDSSGQARIVRGYL